MDDTDKQPPTTPAEASEPVAPSDAPSDVPPPHTGNADAEADGKPKKVMPKGGRPPGSKSKSVRGKLRANAEWALAQLTRKELVKLMRGSRLDQAFFRECVKLMMPRPGYMKPEPAVNDNTVQIQYVDEGSIRMGELHDGHKRMRLRFDNDLDDTPAPSGTDNPEASAPEPDVSEPKPDAPQPVPAKLTTRDILRMATDRNDPAAKELRALIQSAALDQGVNLSDLEAKYAERRRAAMEAEARIRQARMLNDDSCWRGSDNDPFDDDLPRQF
jgi:hypothetical protein